MLGGADNPNGELGVRTISWTLRRKPMFTEADSVQTLYVSVRWKTHSGKPLRCDGQTE
ncbi:Uncharacterised protein [Yersinia ruckeri]|nr:hypothetical protein QMA0440_03090 [Yersinia ruckeri]KFE37407.1 hypothetical protein nADLYRO1b_3177 [Yersinia ruckeri]CNC15497.1 Uncharacterised protein [Yersinia ruckeri]